MVVQPFPVWMLLATLILLAPLNALIFAIDNLVYLLYPYRLNQEGIEIFLRTTLTFTAKGLIFTAGLLLTLGWAFGRSTASPFNCRRLSRTLRWCSCWAAGLC